nr:NAD(P)/FAD-dependent oxidoreductase [uncultured Halomonas sp.]
MTHEHSSDVEIDVVIIGAGPAGAAAASQLTGLGHEVRVLERSHFPRFSIGESLLPQCMSYLETAGLLETVQAANYQFKNGAAFTCGTRTTAIDFREKFTPGWGTTYQIERADFDHRLIQAAADRGAKVDFGVTVTDVRPDATRPRVSYVDENGKTTTLTARFLLDASGYGRVLARKLDLERDPRLEPRMAVFTHVEDHIDDPDYDREKILIGVHPDDASIWYWLIPFANGHASVGVVGAIETLEQYGDSAEARWHALIDAEPRYRQLLRNARPVRPFGELKGYSADVSNLHGPGYALLGNAGEFLDPVFSSGVTIALHSAIMAAPLVDRHLRGESVDWHTEFEAPLRHGIDTFRAFVDAWYDGRLQSIVFSEAQPDGLKRMISAVLAGYAWDQDNPFVSNANRRLSTLAQLCGYLPRQTQSSPA